MHLLDRISCAERLATERRLLTVEPARGAGHPQRDTKRPPVVNVVYTLSTGGQQASTGGLPLKLDLEQASLTPRWMSETFPLRLATWVT